MSIITKVRRRQITVFHCSRFFDFRPTLIGLLILILLVACSGGGGGGSGPAAIDTDSDGISNNADTDDDNDGVNDSSDAFPLDATEWVDTDSDGTGNNADTDDDADGVTDLEDNCPLMVNSSQLDTDDDLVGDECDTEVNNFILPSGARSLVAPVVTTSLSDDLLNCTVLLESGQGCDFNTAPLIGMETTNPTIDDVMARVFVSHDWMATRFREILDQMPTEVLLMTRGLTAIVISYDIRPSFYTAETAAIYIDPDSIWLTEEEEATVDQTPDYRSGFSSELQFTFLRRNVQGNTDLRSFPRSLETVSLATADLLFHELAHANDFASPDRIDSINTFQQIVSALLGSSDSFPSTYLKSIYPLGSSTMFSLAKVSFIGETATAVQKNLSPEDVSAEFSVDFANDYYSYTSQYEDLAMLFEEAMLYYSFDISRDIAFTNSPGTNFCSDYIVSWGLRNRIGDPAIQARAMYVVDALLPEIAAQIEDRLADMPPPAFMTPGVDWCSNITLTASPQTGLIIQPENLEPPSVERIIPFE